MNLADKVTSVRLFIAPVFFAVYIIPLKFSPAFPEGAAWTVPVLWALFFISEITDWLDGRIARTRGETSDFGKLFDPFADTLMQISCFLCFVVDGILPSFLFLLVLYREFSILLVRNLMLRKGIAMGARMGGKIKTVAYILAVGAALLAASFERLNLDSLFAYTRIAAIVLFIVSVILSLLSFADYIKVYRGHGENAGEKK